MLNVNYIVFIEFKGVKLRLTLENEISYSCKNVSVADNF